MTRHERTQRESKIEMRYVGEQHSTKASEQGVFLGGERVKQGT